MELSYVDVSRQSKIVKELGDVSIEVQPSLLIDGSTSESCFGTTTAFYDIDVISTQMFPESAPSVLDDRQVTPLLFSKMVDFSLSGVEVPLGSDIERGAVVYKMVHKTKAHYEPGCKFWEDKALRWDEFGCSYDEIHSTLHKTVCVCDHLTNFAIIMGGNATATGNQKPLEIISLTLGAISAACLLAALVIILTFKWHRNSPEMRAKKYHVIKANRNACLFLGQVLFLTVVGIINSVTENGCIAITFVTHYIWVAAFSWMGVEGFTYLVNFKFPFRGRSIQVGWPHYIFGYGFPLVVALCTFLPAFLSDNGYYRYDACWLSDPYIWGFMSIVALFILFNTVVFYFAIRFITNVRIYCLSH